MKIDLQCKLFLQNIIHKVDDFEFAKRELFYMLKLQIVSHEF